MRDRRRMKGKRYAWPELAAVIGLVGAVVLISAPPGPESTTPFASGPHSPDPSTASGQTEALRSLRRHRRKAHWRPCTIKPGRFVRSGPSRKRRVALTFDDGPSRYTDAVLKTLRRHEVKATFFMNGIWMKDRQSVIRRVADDGHEIGNHGYSHHLMTTMKRGQMRDELEWVQALTEKAAGEKPCLFRAPYGKLNRKVTRELRRRKLATVGWNVESRDYAHLPRSTLAKNVLSAVKPGSIVLMHDGGGSRQETVAALPKILKGLKRRRLKPVTVTALFKSKKSYKGSSSTS